MSNAFRSAVFLCLLINASMLFGQDRPVITASSTAEIVRFASPGGGAQMRVQMISSAGELLFDSDWSDGNVFDWPVGNLASGPIRCIVMARDLEGRVTRREAAITSREGHVSIEPGAADGITLAGVSKSVPKITVLTHDQTSGAIVSTDGDLSFRFGDVLAARDTERMRLTAGGKLGIGTDKPQAALDVNGFIRTSKGIMFDDGTILTTAGTQPVGEESGIPRQAGGTAMRPANVGREPRPAILPLVSPASRLIPRTNFAPAYQFTVGDLGVSVGTTNPAYKLDVNGPVNTLTGYDIGGSRVVSADFAGNAIVGISAGSSNAGTSNSFFGSQAGQSNTTGTNNAFFGYQSGISVITGANNAFFGFFSGVFTTGSFDAFVGSRAGFANTSGGGNTALGWSALTANTSGNNNIAIGSNAGMNLTTGHNNIDIGNGGVAAEANTIRLGDDAFQTRAFIAGISGRSTGGTSIPVIIDGFGQLGTAPSSRRYKYDIVDMDRTTDDLMQLRPVTFRYLAQGSDAPLQYGLIAEEVAEIYPELVMRNKDGQVEAVAYQFLAPMLLNEVQKQHRTIEEQKSTIDALTARLDALGQRLQALETQVSRDK
jgi:endosialidase-like protein